MNLVDLVKSLFHEPYFVCVLALLACGCFYYIRDGKSDKKKIVWIVYSGLFACAILTFILGDIYRALNPQVWDFTVFYLYGKVGAGGHNFYSPQDFHAVLNSLQLPFQEYTDFKEEIANVGFLYPPPTMFYFAPLGFLSFQTASIVWTLFNFFFIVGCIYLIFELFFKPYKLNGLILGCILFCILAPSLSTISASQTNFILLFYLLMMKKYQNSKWAGVFLALACLTKPYMGIFVLFFVAIKNFKAILYFIVSAAVIAGLTLAVFGMDQFRSYIFDSPFQRIPADIYSETVNQSLQAVLLRANIISMDNPITYTYISVGILIISGAFAFSLVKRKLYDYFWALLLLVVLIIYPNTLASYGVMLLFIIFQFFNEKKQMGIAPVWNIFIIGLFYFLSTFSLFVSLWFLLAVLVINSFRKQVPEKIGTIKPTAAI